MVRSRMFFSMAALVSVSAFAAPGDLDPNFGSSGKVLIDVGGLQNDAPNAMTIDAAGNLYVAGIAKTPTSSDFGVMRLLPSGQLDPSFGTGGKVHVDIGTNTNDRASAIALDAQGDIRVSGVTDVSGRDQFTAIKLSHGGVLDGGYGSAGHALVDNPTTSNDSCCFMAIDTDGSVFLTGASYPSGKQTIKVAKLTPGGGASAFGGIGYVVSPFRNSSTAIGAVPLASGDVYVGASITTVTPNINFDMALVKYDSAGNVDTTFGDFGASYADINYLDVAASIVRDASGNFFIVGRTQTTNSSNMIGIAKFDPAGALVDAFGTHGVTSIATAGAGIFGMDAKVDADGNLYITGAATGQGGVVASIAHVDGTTGTPIASFGSGGIATVDIASHAYGGVSGVIDAARQRFCFASNRGDFNKPALFAVSCVQTAPTNEVFRADFEQ